MGRAQILTGVPKKSRVLLHETSLAASVKHDFSGWFTAALAPIRRARVSLDREPRVGDAERGEPRGDVGLERAEPGR